MQMLLKKISFLNSDQITVIETCHYRAASIMAVGNVLSRGVFVVAAKRTPFGTFGGSLKGHSPVDLQVLASNGAMQSIGLKPELVNSVCIGNVLSASSPDAPYLARHVALRCGLPIPTPAYVGKTS